MEGFEKDERALEAVRNHYKCNSKYRCPDYDNCWFGDGENTSYDCNECAADEFYAGYMQCLFDKSN